MRTDGYADLLRAAELMGLAVDEAAPLGPTLGAVVSVAPPGTGRVGLSASLADGERTAVLAAALRCAGEHGGGEVHLLGRDGRPLAQAAPVGPISSKDVGGRRSP